MPFRRSLLRLSCGLLLAVSARAATLVGTLGGSVSVDNHGAANYSVPLVLPAGRAGLEPKLSINYNSGGGNGTLGVGFSLSTGFPQAITRGRSILARDGVVRGVNFDANDKYYLDGKRLICVSGTEGSPGSTYRTEVDSFVTISTTGTGTNIDTFTVADKSGLTFVFGKHNGTSDGYQVGAYDANGDAIYGSGEFDSLAYTYALKHVEDTVGNSVDFTYTVSSTTAEAVLTSISYTGSGVSGAGAGTTILLVYGTSRTDKLENYIAGRRFSHSKRLEHINVQSNHSGVSAADVISYDLGYEAAPKAGPSRLVTITPRRSDASGAQIVNSTSIRWTNHSFEYGQPPAANPPYQLPIVTATALRGVDECLFTGDFNGDGKDDYLRIDSSGALYVSLADGSTWGTETIWATAQAITAAVGSSYYVMGTGDINGDGKRDVVIGSSAFDKLYFVLSNASGTAFTAPVMAGDISDQFADKYMNGVSTRGNYLLNVEGHSATSRITVADYTGDGLDDILVNSYDGHLYLWQSQGTGFSAKGQVSGVIGGQMMVDTVLGWDWSPVGIRMEKEFTVKPMPCDINGDGRMDYVLVETSRTIQSSYYSSSRQLKASISRPDGTFSPAQVVVIPWMINCSATSAIKQDDVSSGVIPGDFNGDGTTDFLILCNMNVMGWHLALSTGKTDANGAPLFNIVYWLIPDRKNLGADQVLTYGKAATATGWLNFYGNYSNIRSLGFMAEFIAMEALGPLNTTAMDVNGDGLADFVWYVNLTAADGTLTNSASQGWWAMLSTGTFAGGSPTSFGSGFTEPIQLSSLPSGYRPASTLPSFNSTAFSPLDVNGDGHPDLLSRVESNGQTTGFGPCWLSTGAFGDLPESVTNGLGEKTSLTFKGAKDDALYTPGVAVTYPIRELRASTPVVSDLYRDPGSAANADAVPAADRAHFSYQYSGRRLDLSGRGDLGFHSFVTLDEQTKVFKYQFLTQSFPMTGLVSREQTYRYWENATSTPTYVRFRLLSSHDNTVVFDEVVNASGTAYGTVYPFISRAVESRWEDSNSYQFTWAKADATGPAETRSESLFPQALPTGAHIQITATSLFDNQTAVQTTVPGTYDPSDADPTSHANSVTGYASYASYTALTLPQKITYGNLTQLTTDYGDSFTEKVTNTYYAATAGTNLTGRVNTVTTTVTSPGYGSQTAPVKTYTYKTGTPLVTSETLDASDDQLDLVTTYTRDTLGRVTATSLKSASLNAGSTYTVSSVVAFDDRFDLPAAVQDNYAHQTSTTYDAILGKPVSVTDVPNNATVTSQYDALGRLTQTVDQLKGLQTDTTIAATTSSATDWKKTQTVSGPSDADGVPTGSTIVGVKAVALTSAYAVRTVTTVQPPVTTYYDRLGRAIRTIKEGFAGQKTYTDTAYNNLGQVVATSVPYLSTGTAYWTKTDYDPLGRVSTVTAPNGTVTTTTYKGRATVVSVKATDRTAQVNSTVVDAKGATVKVWNADNVPTFTDTLGTTTTAASVAFTLDGFGRMRVTTLNGQTQTITAGYDAFGRQTSLNDPDKGAWAYVNDALGRVTSQTDAVGNVTATSYDRLNRPLTRTTTEAAGPVETATWYYYDWMNDSAKHLVAVGDQGWFLAPAREESVTTGAPGYGAPKTTTVHYYDPKGRPAIDLATIDGKYFYTYTSYDAYSRVDHVRHYWRPAGKEAPSVAPYVWQDFGYHYTYDAESYLLSVTDTATPNRTWWEADATTGYDYLDRPVKVKKAGAYTTNRTYDPEDGTLTAIQTGLAAATDVQNLSFTYDGLGNLTNRTDTLRSLPEALTYDTLNRLVTSKQGTTGYLANGNLSSKVSVTGAASGTYAYDATHPHAVKTAFGYTMGYDANGNLLTRTKTGEAWDLEWTGFDKPRWMAKSTTVGSTTTTVGSEFSYNANRSRVLQLEFDAMSGGAPSHYVRKRIYALGSTLEINYANSAAAGVAAAWSLADVRIYVPGPDGVIGAREFTPGVSASLAEKTLVYHYDHLGSIQVVTKLDAPSATPAADDAGKPAVFSEDAWGQRRDPLDWIGAPVTTDDGGADSVTPRGFTGHEMLDDLGLVHMNGRIYDPVLGRFLSADLLVQNPGDLQAYNRYSYVRNNPLTATDPSGWADDNDDKSGLLAAVGNLIKAYIPAQASLPNDTGGGSALSQDADDIAQRSGIQSGISEANHTLAVEAKGVDMMLSTTPAGLGKDLVQAAAGKDINGNDASRGDALKSLGVQAGVGVAGKAAKPLVEAGAEAAGKLVGTVAKALSKEGSTAGRIEIEAVKDGVKSEVPTLVSNPKHNPNSVNPEPSNVSDIYKGAVPDKNGVRWAVDKDGTIHRFAKASNGETHWNGSTGDKKPIETRNIPNDMLKKLKELWDKMREKK